MQPVFNPLPPFMPHLSDKEIDKLVKMYNEMDGNHTKFMGDKREYVYLTSILIENFMDSMSGTSKYGENIVEKITKYYCDKYNKTKLWFLDF
jgi:hypothetical protein